MRLGLVVSFALAAGCNKKSEDRPAGDPTATPQPITPTAAADAGEPEAEPVGKAVDNPDWPCGYDTGSDKIRFRYEGPPACHAPPDIVITGCPTLEEMDNGGDGTIDRFRTFKYDTKGDLVT